MGRKPIDTNIVKEPLIREKRVSSRQVIVTQVIQTNLPTDGNTYYFGQYFDVGDASKVLLNLATTSFTKGSLSGLKCVVQAKSFNGSDFNIPVESVFPANPFAADPAASFTQVFASFSLPLGFQILRIGFTCTTAHTSGQISAVINISKK